MTTAPEHLEPDQRDAAAGLEIGSQAPPETTLDISHPCAPGPQEDEQLTMGALAEQVSLTTGGVTRLVDRMEAAGYVERMASPSDRRVMFVALTDTGTAKLSEASDVHGANVRAMFEGFSDRELAVMGRLLERLGVAVL